MFKYITALLFYCSVAAAQEFPYFVLDNIISGGGGGGGGLCNTNAVPDPATNTITAWWVASDYNNSAGNLWTNWWYDRITCYATKSCQITYGGYMTNTTDGMYSWQAPATGFTNNPPMSPGTNATFAITFKVTGIPAGSYDVLWSPAEIDDFTQSVGQGGPRGFMINGFSGNQMYWGSPFRGGQPITVAIGTSPAYWIDLIMIQSNTVALFYTNGVFSTSVSTTPPVGGWPFYLWDGTAGNASANGIVGYYKEVAAWSNTVFTATSISNYHRYLTNTYGYTP